MRSFISRGRGRLVLLALAAALVAMFAFFAGGAQAVWDTGRFQLDGDASSSTQPFGPPATDDWDNVCHQANPVACPTGASTTNATAVSWLAEADPNSSIFTGGGSKDPSDVSSWAWKDGAGGLPDKDNLEHAFAARYSLPPDPVDSDPPGAGNLGNGTACPADSPAPLPPAPSCELLVFGSDRFDNSGDAQQGFWFFQNKINLGNVKSGGGFNFTGVHKDGDLLVISDFSNGGTTSTITVYVWDHTVSGNLRLLETSDNAKCSTAQAGAPFCGIVNPSNGTAAPWPFNDKSGNQSYLNGEFYEGGINLTALGLGDECFASLASETRSSTSTTATLKDFVLGSFASCGASASTTPSSSLSGGTVTPGTSVTDLAVITGSGVSTPPNPSSPPNVVFTMCGPIAVTSTTLACDGSDGAHTASTTVGTSKALVHCTGAGTPSSICTAADTQGVSRARSDAVNTSGSPLAAGIYCFKATWAGDSNYPNGASHIGNSETGSECFRVRETTTTATAQKWLPNDSATVLTSGSQPAPAGSVTFTLYSNGTCTPGTADANVLHVFPDIALNTSDGTAATNNSTFGIATTPGRTISWKATYTPTNADATVGSTSVCETSTVTIDDDGP